MRRIIMLQMLLVAIAALFTSSTLMAGTFNVTAAGTAVVTLTNEDEVVVLDAIKTDVDIVVMTTSPEGDFISVPHSLEGVKNIVLNVRGGSNSVTADFHEFEGYVTIRSGNEDDSVFLSGSIGGNLSIITAGGDDSVTVIDTSALGFTTISTASGDDHVDISDLYAVKRLQLLTGLGDDAVLMGSVSVSTIENGVYMNYLQPQGGIQPNRNVVLLSNATINTSSGDDDVHINDISVYGLFNLSTGAGFDVVTINGSDFNSSVLVNAGAQDDDVTATDTGFYGSTTFKGASGSADIYRDDESNMFFTTSVNTSFEQFLPPVGPIIDVEICYELNATVSYVYNELPNECDLSTD